MLRHPTRVHEHLVIIGGYLFGAIVGPIVLFVCLIPLVIMLTSVLWLFSFYLFVFVPILSPVVAVRCAEAAHRAYLQRRQVPLLSVAGYLLTGLLLAWGVPYLNAAFAHTDSDLPSALELAYIGYSLHSGILWGGIVGREAAGWETGNSRSSLAYPLWGYVVGGIGAVLFTFFLRCLPWQAGGWAYWNGRVWSLSSSP